MFKMGHQKNVARLQRMKNTIKNKTNKNQKKTWNNYCLGCKNYTQNLKPQEVVREKPKMTKKVVREKPNCVVCESSKSKFLKQKHKTKK